MLASVLASCKDKEQQDGGAVDSNSSDESASESTPDDEPLAFYEISVEELTNYTIVYPETAGDDIKNAVNALASALSMKFDVAPRAVIDKPVDYKGDSLVGDYEIIIGNSRRDEAEQFLSSIEYSDRGYAIIGKKLVIAAHDPFVTANTVVEFSSVVRNMSGDAKVFFNSDMNKVTRGSYTYGTIQIDGTDISKYSIVYPSGKNFERNLAQRLWRAIAEECGSILPIKTDKDAASGREIIIGKTTRPISTTALSGVSDGRGLVALESGSVCLCGNSALGVATATEAFINSFYGGQKTETLTLTVNTGLVSDTSSLSTMTFNVDSDGVTSARTSKVIETITRYLPDTVGLQECSAEWKRQLTSNLGDYYGYIGVGRDADGTGLASAILYAKEKFTLVDSGTKWLSGTPDTVSAVEGSDANYTFTYAILKSTDGTEYMHINTQLGNTAEVRTAQARLLLDFIYQHSDKAIILTGDLNCIEGSTEFNSLVSEFMRHCAAISKKSSLGTFSKKNLSDTLLCYDKYMDISYMEVVYKRIDGEYASPSFAAYAEFSINYDGTEFEESGITSGGNLTWEPDREGEDYPPFIPFN